jgi:hypothetical protein
MNSLKRALIVAAVVFGAVPTLGTLSGCGEPVEEAAPPIGKAPETRTASPEEQAQRGSVRGGSRGDQHN